MANKVYINPETTITWLNTGGDLDMDLGGLAADAVQMGAYSDRGAAARAQDYAFELLIDGFDTVPVVGESVDLYFAQSNATTNFDGNPTTDPTAVAEGVMTTDQLKNTMFANSAIVYSTTAANKLKITGTVRLTSRYISPVVHNNTADALLSTADAHSLILTPIPIEIQ